MGIKKKKLLGELLIEDGAITRKQLEEALQEKSVTGQRLGDILKNKKFTTDSQIMKVLERQLGVSYIDLDRITIDPDIASLVPVTMARHHKLVPVRIENNKLLVAMDDPYSFLAIEDVRMVAHLDIEPLLAREESILNAIETLYGNELAEKAIEEFSREINLDEIVADITEETGNEIGNAPIVRLVNSLIEQAVREGASDIHVEPAENNVRIRFRVDGKLHNELTAPKAAQSAIITRIKIMANLNIAEKRVPQDGRYEMTAGEHNIDLRVSTLPGVYGEKVVMRVLDRNSFLRPKNELGFTEENLNKFEELINNPNGIILITGPTGSGKSTTLYTMLSELNQETENIITIEDPVEYIMAGINQVQVNPKAGLTFAAGLRSILRQDPDIIMIGEIRDQETVDIAVRAAITGHLVLSTIHTNDSASTISRLIDMGVEPYMLSSALVGIISQRLVRRICPLCRQEYKPSPSELDFLDLPYDSKETFFKGAGCGNCSETGYRGRIAIHEILPITRNHRDMIHRGAGVDEIRDYSMAHGMSSLKQEAIKLLRQGITTIDEVVHIAYSKEKQKGPSVTHTENDAVSSKSSDLIPAYNTPTSTEKTKLEDTASDTSQRVQNSTEYIAINETRERKVTNTDVLHFFNETKSEKSVEANTYQDGAVTVKDDRQTALVIEMNQLKKNKKKKKNKTDKENKKNKEKKKNKKHRDDKKNKKNKNRRKSIRTYEARSSLQGLSLY